MANSNAKLAAGVLGGYVLGRTKKGKAAIRLAMWISNNRGPVSQAISKTTKNEETAAFIAQLQGPILEAVQQAAINAATARMQQLTGNLIKRTEGLTKSVGDTAGQATDTLGETTKSITGVLGGNDDKPEETEEKPESEQAEKPASKKEAPKKNGDEE